MVFEMAIIRSMQRLRDFNFKKPLSPLAGPVLYEYICKEINVNSELGGLPISKEIKTEIWGNCVLMSEYKSELVRYYLDKVNRTLYNELIQYIPKEDWHKVSMANYKFIQTN